VGNHLSGQLGASQVVSQTSFDNLNRVLGTFVAVNNELTTDRFFGSAEWEFHPRWRTGAGLAQSSGDNSTLVQRSQDFDQDNKYAYVTYLTPKGSKLRGELRRIDAEFPNRQLVAGSLVDNSYTQNEVNFVGDWSVTGKLVNHLRVGWVERQHENLSTSDFSGVAGRYSADYFPTGKTVVSAAVFREPAGVEAANSSFRLNTGVNVNVAWLLSDKTTVRAGASYVDSDYDQIVPGGLKRNDDDTNGSLSVSYSPIPMATFDAGLQVGRRNSTIDALDYTFRSVFVGARADF
jgi:exopolysaccharide biosynthesis operon protein EpsL